LTDPASIITSVTTPLSSFHRIESSTASFQTSSSISASASLSVDALSSAETRSVPLGAVVGGVLGGIVLLGCILLSLQWWRRRPAKLDYRENDTVPSLVDTTGLITAAPAPARTGTPDSGSFYSATPTPSFTNIARESTTMTGLSLQVVPSSTPIRTPRTEKFHSFTATVSKTNPAQAGDVIDPFQSRRSSRVGVPRRDSLYNSLDSLIMAFGGLKERVNTLRSSVNNANPRFVYAE
jgi:hypothetical protein